MSRNNVQSLQENSDTDTLVPPDHVDGGTICLQKLSVFGHSYPQASPNGTVRARPSSIPAGTTHTISAAYAAKVLGIGLDAILDSASNGKVFCRAAWTFPGHRYPMIRTRHEVVTGEAADISFSGGLGWALEQLAYFAARRQSAPFAKVVSRRRPSGASVHVKRPRQTLLSQALSSRNPVSVQPANGLLPNPRIWSEFQGGAFLPPARSLTSSPANLGSGILAPTPVSASTQALTLMGSTPFKPGDQTGGPFQTSTPNRHLEEGDVETTYSPEPLTRATSRQSTPSWDSDPELQQDATASQPETRTQIARLRQKRRAAEDLYARIGDTSGHTALLQHAAQHSEVWYPSRRPRF